MKLTAHILLEVEVDAGTPAPDVALAVTAAAELAAARVRGEGFRAVTFSVATTRTSRDALNRALAVAVGAEVIS